MSETAAPCDFTECENADRHLWPETSPVDAPDEKLFVTSAGGIGINIGGHVIVQPLREWHRLAASQPDREAVAAAVRGALVENWKDDFAAWNEDVLLTGCRRVGGGRGYQKPEEAAQNLALDAADAILSLLSGAGTKSAPPVSASHNSGERVPVSDAALGGADTSPGPDVRRRVLDILNAVAPAVENLAGHQEQCDMDGVMVKVSRQALDEVLNAVNEVALVSALTRPLGGFVQGSIATRPATSGTAASGTETAIREALEFYADPWAWKKLHDPDDLIRIPDFYSELSFGGAAQEALATIEAASKRPILSVSGNIHREQQRDTMDVTAGETAPNSPAVAETDADAQRDDGLLSGVTSDPTPT